MRQPPLSDRRECFKNRGGLKLDGRPTNSVLSVVFFCSFCLFFQTGSWLFLNSLSRAGYLQTQRSISLYLLRAGITSVYHHVQLEFSHFRYSVSKAVYLSSYSFYGFNKYLLNSYYQTGSPLSIVSKMMNESEAVIRKYCCGMAIKYSVTRLICQRLHCQLMGWL